MAVYMVQAGQTGPIKIGKAEEPRVRLRELQCGNHELLRLVRTFDGGRQEERWLHAAFSHRHLQGEWFSFDPRMLTIEVPALVQKNVGSPVAGPFCQRVISDIERFCQEHHLTDRQFSLAAVGHAKFMLRLRSGLSSAKSIDAADRFMAERARATDCMEAA